MVAFLSIVHVGDPENFSKYDKYAINWLNEDNMYLGLTTSLGSSFHRTVDASVAWVLGRIM